MRFLIVLLACGCVLTEAAASDASSAMIKPAAAEVAAGARENPRSAAQEVTSAKALAAKISARLATMRPGTATESSAAAEAADAAHAAKVARINAPFRKKRKTYAGEPLMLAASSQVYSQVPSQVASHASSQLNAAAASHELHWSYEGEGGPIRWGKLNSAWAKCDSGVRQSPIDIRDGIKVDLEPIGFDYKPSRFNVLDNGHTVQVNLGGGNQIEIMGRKYQLVQFHFHRPSEERINGMGFDMVAHLVHQDADGRLAVVAVLLERGKAHSLMQTVWNNLPLEKNLLVEPGGLIDMNQFLPLRREYYTYMGSLTTPPCSEGVLWMIMKEPVQVSAEQIAIFGRLYPMNARPVQASAGRLIKESN